MAETTTRQALAELVACKDLADQFDALKQDVHDFATAAVLEGIQAEYQRRKPLAWAAARAALAAQPVAGAVATDETGWLIEHSGEILPGAEQRAQVSWLRVQMKFNGYGAREFGFTHDANEALRFARKEDAEAVLAMHLGASPPDWYSKPFSVTEHMWPAASQAQAAPAPEPTSDETLTWEKPPSAIEGRLGVWLTSGAELHPRTVNLVVRFARALASKLAAAEAKYGYSDGWASPDWMDECRAKLMEHIAKGDPRDVAAYCAFLWHHGASTARPEPSAQGRPCPFGCTTQEEHDAHQSAEPSAQGEPVATVTEEMVTAYLTANDAYWKRIDGEPTKLGKWRNGTPSEATRVSLMAALASAPSTPPPAVVDERETFEAFIAKDGGDLHTFGTGADMHYRNSGVNHTWIGWKARARLAAHAVVEAVPLTDEQADALRRLWPAIEKAMGCLVFTAEQAGAVQADMNTVRHGIAPKAAQEKT